jgi:hypothetical protein
VAGRRQEDHAWCHLDLAAWAARQLPPTNG